MTKIIQLPDRSEHISGRHLANLNPDLKISFQLSQSRSQPDFMISRRGEYIGFAESAAYCSKKYRQHIDEFSKSGDGFILRSNARQNWIVNTNFRFCKHLDVDSRLSEIEQHPSYRLGDELNTLTDNTELQPLLTRLAQDGISSAIPYFPVEDGRDCHMLMTAALGGLVHQDTVIPNLNEIIKKKSYKKRSIQGEIRILTIVFDAYAPCNEVRAAFECDLSHSPVDFRDFTDVFLIPDHPCRHYSPYRLGPD